MDLETRVACSLLFGLAWAALAAAAIAQTPLTPPPASTTPPTPEWPGCQHNGQLFADGDRVEWSPCYVCLCYQRQVICSLPVTCPECPNAIPDPGHCCPICPDPPMTTTPMTPITPATQEWPGCFHDGQLYQEGQAVVSDPCYGCWCSEQQIVCSSPPTCAYCENPIQVEGQCCPLCPTTTPHPTTTPPRVCQQDGRYYTNGQTVQSDDPCQYCFCEDGNVICLHGDCFPQCDNPVYVPGQCCPLCEPTTTTTTTEIPTGPGPVPQQSTPPPPTTPTGCERDGTTYEPGQPIITNDPCLHCVCSEGGEEHCMHAFCEYFINPCPNPIHVPGQCCPLCEPTTTPPPPPPETYPPPTTPPEWTCERDGRVFRHGEDILIEKDCLRCTCEYGREDCMGFDCPSFDCWKEVYLPGQCCPVCEERPPTRCQRDGRMYFPGEAMDTGDPCLHCFCMEGRGEVCMHLLCDNFINPCPNPIHVPGQCCPLCEPTTTTTTPPTETYPLPTTPPQPTCERDGRVYRHGEEIQTNDPCYRCTCRFGHEACLVEDCFPIDCWNPAYVPGRCCPVCEERPPTTTPNTPSPPCQRDGRMYFPGEVMNTGDPCLHCTCDYSGEVCYHEDCYSFFFPCPNPVFTPGQCCPQCGSTTTSTETPTTPPGPTPPPPPTPPSPTPDITPRTMCERDGLAFQHGDAVPSSDPCDDCSCQEGQVVCYRRLCLKPSCKNPISVPGQCCPYCAKGCTYDNKNYAHGRVIRTGDPCQKCKCNDGEVDCTVKQCPKRSCKRTVTKPGVCCPVCEKSRLLP